MVSNNYTNTLVPYSTLFAICFAFCKGILSLSTLWYVLCSRTGRDMSSPAHILRSQPPPHGPFGGQSMTPLRQCLSRLVDHHEWIHPEPLFNIRIS